MAEFGILAPAGPQHDGRLIERISDPEAKLPDSVRRCLNTLADQLVAVHREINAVEADMRRSCREHEPARHLLTIPGIGPVTASALIAAVPSIEVTSSGRDFAAWSGSSTELKWGEGAARTDHEDERSDSASLARDRRPVRNPLEKQGGGLRRDMAGRLLARKPVKLAAVAQANKTARIIWAILTRDEIFRVA